MFFPAMHTWVAKLLVRTTKAKVGGGRQRIENKTNKPDKYLWLALRLIRIKQKISSEKKKSYGLFTKKAQINLSRQVYLYMQPRSSHYK